MCLLEVLLRHAFELQIERPAEMHAVFSRVMRLAQRHPVTVLICELAVCGTVKDMMTVYDIFPADDAVILIAN